MMLKFGYKLMAPTTCSRILDCGPGDEFQEDYLRLETMNSNF